MKKQLYVVESRKNTKPKVLPIDPNKSDDPFYRYKMRQLLVQVVGKGKMIRTAMLNLDNVAHDLQVPPDYIPNFFGKSIGATAKYDPKKPERERGSISGEYDIAELSETLIKFIRVFVLCRKCEYPEYEYRPVKKNIRIKCKSCGFKANVHKLDLGEKFKRYVINHPPPKPKKITKAQPPKKSSKTQKSTMAKEGWSGNVDEEAVKERMNSMVPANLQGLVADEDEGTEVDEPTRLGTVLAKYVTNHQDAEEINAEVGRMSELYGMKHETVPAVLFKGLFATEMTKIYSNLQKYGSILQTQLSDEVSQVRFLRAMEGEIEENDETDAICKQLAGLFQYMEAQEIVDEESFFEWRKSKPVLCTSMRKAAKPFLNWLEEAAESSEEDASEEAASEEEPEKKPGTSVDDVIDAL